ncbi:MAG: hypothetical protein QOI38_688 [Sphingomonadales bacterium]|jgi:hypothetical protein|nr:hypothetical protein [Sphingomonadales bacterium]
MIRRLLVGLAVTATAQAAPLFAARPGLGGGEDLGVSLGRIVGALLICTAVAALAILLIRQRSGRIDLRAMFARIELRQRPIQVVETRRLSAHADICLLRHEGRDYLLLLTAGRSQVLHESDSAAPGKAEGQGA